MRTAFNSVNWQLICELVANMNNQQNGGKDNAWSSMPAQTNDQAKRAHLRRSAGRSRARPHDTGERQKRVVASDALACDGFAAGLALLGVEASEALEAVGAVVARGEVLAGQLRFTAAAHKALLVPRLVPVGHAAFGQGLKR